MQDAEVPKTPKRAERSPKPGSRFLSEVVADTIRAVRVLRRMSQSDLADEMRRLGHETWSRAAVSDVERYGRRVSLDELASLAVVLRIPPGKLLDPFDLPPGGGDWLADIDVGTPTPIPAGLVAFWASGELTVGVEPDGGLWLDWHTAAAQQAAEQAIKAQKAAIADLSESDDAE